MASSKEFLVFLIEQLRCYRGDITFRQMMGEYLIYADGVYFGGVFDDRFLVKKTKTNEKYALDEELPYDGAKPMYKVEDLDDMEYLSKLVEDTIIGLK